MSAGASERQRYWRPRLTVRARLTLICTALIALAGVVMVGLVTVFMRTVPTYLEPTVVETGPSGPTGPMEGTTPGDASTAAPTTPTAVTFALQSPIDILNAVLVVSIAVLVLIVLVGGVVAWVIAGRVLRPLQSINAVARRAGAGDLSQRVGATGPRDEVRELSDAFDDMLMRLAASFEAHQRFAANASHELRTPMATTQTVLEVALDDPGATVKDLRMAAGKVLATNRRSIETVNALLDLAEIGQRPLERERIDLGDLVAAVMNEVGPEMSALELHVATDIPAGLAATGDAVLVRQAVGNLVLNAVRHNVRGGFVRLSAKPTGSTLTISVENTGELIKPERVHELVEPFVRGAGRTMTGVGTGHGLGLAIVRRIVDAHEGSFELAARDGGGLKARLVLPRTHHE